MGRVRSFLPSLLFAADPGRLPMMEQSLVDAPSASGQELLGVQLCRWTRRRSHGICRCLQPRIPLPNSLQKIFKLRAGKLHFCKKTASCNASRAGEQSRGQSCAKQPGQGCACPLLALRSWAARGELAPLSSSARRHPWL